MEKIVLFDTAEASNNLGDQIIMDYCEQQLNNIFIEPYFTYKIPTHLEVAQMLANLISKQNTVLFVVQI